MYEIIIAMIQEAEETNNYRLIDSIKELIDKFALTHNCPSGWRSVGEELAGQYKDNEWVYDNLELWNHDC